MHLCKMFKENSFGYMLLTDCEIYVQLISTSLTYGSDWPLHLN